MGGHRRSKHVKTTEYLIIGAGVLGVFTTYFLADKGKEVVIIDEKSCCSEASGVSAGNLDILKLAPKMVPLAVRGIKLWEMFEKDLGLDVGFRRIGGVNAAFTETEVETGRIQRDALRNSGVEADIFQGKEMETRFPYLSKHVKSVVYSPFIGYADPNVAGPRVLQAAQAKGAEFLSHVKAISISQSSNGGYDVETSEGRVHANKVLVCCGVRSPKLLDPMGLHLSFELRKNLVTVTEKMPPLMPELVTGTQLSMKQTHHGSIIIGGGWQGFGDLERNEKILSNNNLAGNLSYAARIVPDLERVNVLRCWVGFDSIYPDKTPVMTEVPNYKGLYAAITGSVGFTVAPFVGMQLAEMMSV